MLQCINGEQKSSSGHEPSSSWAQFSSIPENRHLSHRKHGIADSDNVTTTSNIDRYFITTVYRYLLLIYFFGCKVTDNFPTKTEKYDISTFIYDILKDADADKNETPETNKILSILRVSLT